MKRCQEEMEPVRLGREQEAGVVLAGGGEVAAAAWAAHLRLVPPDDVYARSAVRRCRIRRDSPATRARARNAAPQWSGARPDCPPTS